MAFCGCIGFLFVAGVVGLLATLTGAGTGLVTKSTTIGAASAGVLAARLNAGLFFGLYFTTPANAPPEVFRQSFSFCVIFGSIITMACTALTVIATAGLVKSHHRQPTGKRACLADKCD